jgi:hypothetical protein
MIGLERRFIVVDVQDTTIRSISRPNPQGGFLVGLCKGLYIGLMQGALVVIMTFSQQDLVFQLRQS